VHLSCYIIGSLHRRIKAQQLIHEPSRALGLIPTVGTRTVEFIRGAGRLNSDGHQSHMFLFIPLLFGFQDKRTVVDPTAHVCPKCHNVSVVRASSRMWFSFFLVRVIPLKKKHIWICSICNWHVPTQNGWEPAVSTGNAGWDVSQPGYEHAYQTPHSTGYQPSYDSPPRGY